jgi:hypothetical protein
MRFSVSEYWILGLVDGIERGTRDIDLAPHGHRDIYDVDSAMKCRRAQKRNMGPSGMPNAHESR